MKEENKRKKMKLSMVGVHSSSLLGELTQQQEEIRVATVEENTWLQIGNNKVRRELKYGHSAYDLVSFKTKPTL